MPNSFTGGADRLKTGNGKNHASNNIFGNIKGGLLPFFIILLLIYCVGTAVRYRQHVIISESSIHNYEGQTILASMDGYRWLRYAENYSGGVDRLSGIVEQAKIPPFQPMLSSIISLFDMPKERAGSLLTVFLSSLFVFPFGYYFYLCGLGAAGIGGSVIGSLGLVYFSRTTAFQPDTDMLNLFFPFMIILLIKLTERRVYLFSAAASLFSLLHYYWYFHSGFVTVWFFLLAFNLLMNGYRGFGLIKPLALFAVFSGIYPLLHGFLGLSEFFSADPRAVYSVAVDENRVHGFMESMKLLGGYGWVSLVGLLGAIFTFKRAFLAVPLFTLGCLMFFKGEKYGIYLVPFAGAGIGFLSAYFLKRFGVNEVLVYVFTACLCLLAVRPYMAQLPPPVVSMEVFAALKQAKIPEGSDVVCGWSNGFLIEYLKKVRCSADGATQFKETSRITDRIITSANIDMDALKMLYRGGDMYILLFKNDRSQGSGGGFYADFKCDSLGDCGVMSINAETDPQKVLKLGRVKLTNTEQISTLYGKIGQDRENLAVFDEETKNSLFGRGYIIGQPDIGCLRRIYHDYPHLAVYRANKACF